MNIWVDADACPTVIKEILFRAAERTGIQLILVANQPIKIPQAKNISSLRVQLGFDVADNEIVRRMNPGDLVITGDIPLAAEVLDKKGYALNPRGELYNQNTIKAKLGMRDFMETMRASGIHTGGPLALGQRDRKNFADNLDKLISRNSVSGPE